MSKIDFKDLQIEATTKVGGWWVRQKKQLEEAILNGEQALIADRNTLKLCEKKIEEEKKKFEE